MQLRHVEFMPKELEAGVLYVSERFQLASHLCPCGCGNKIVTPLGLTEWKFSEREGKATLYPSIGNWQIPCQSHYWITDSVIEWSYQWTKEQIQKGREKEQELRESYFQQKNKPPEMTFWQKLWNWIRK